MTRPADIDPTADTEALEREPTHGSGGYTRDRIRALWWIVGLLAVAIVSAVVRHEVMLGSVLQAQADTKDDVREIKGDVKSLLRRSP